MLAYKVALHYQLTLESKLLKIIPVDGKCLVNGEAQKATSEVLPEVVVSQTLSGLRMVC